MPTYIFKTLVLALIILENFAISTDTCSAESCSPLVVQTLAGKVRGSVLRTPTSKDVYAFQGIPYGEPPTGNKRFKDAERKRPWNNVLEVTKRPKMCPQSEKFFKNYQMSEDCLTVSVYSKKTGGNVPVIVLLNGGIAHSPRDMVDLPTGPLYLLEKEVVFVNVNYRIGALGFASLRSEEISGNMGYKDIILALKWIRDNIEMFGGNPGKVTISGHGPGAIAVNALLVSTLSKGLFHRAILMSGALTSHWKPNNKELTMLLANQTGVDPDSIKDKSKVLQHLQSLKWQNILSVTSEWGKKLLPSFKFELEGNFGQDKFLSSSPNKIMANGEFQKVPILIGMTKNEMDFLGDELFVNDEFRKEISVHFDQFLPYFFEYHVRYTKQHTRNITKAIMDHYLRGRKILTEDNKAYFADAITDLFVAQSVNRFVDYVTLNGHRLFVYEFDYGGKEEEQQLQHDPTKTFKKINHGNDLFYIFNTNPVTYMPKAKEYKMIDKMVTMWTQFAATGSPNFHQIERKWEPYTVKSPNILVINERFSYSRDFYFDSSYKYFNQVFKINVK